MSFYWVNFFGQVLLFGGLIGGLGFLFWTYKKDTARFRSPEWKESWRRHHEKMAEPIVIDTSCFHPTAFNTNQPQRSYSSHYSGSSYYSQNSSKPEKKEEKDVWDDDLNMADVLFDPCHSHIPGNIYHHNDYVTDPVYSYMPGNIHHNDYIHDPSYSYMPENIYNNDSVTNPDYSYMPGNISNNDFITDPVYSDMPENINHNFD